MQSKLELTYRQAAVQNATPVGLVIIQYDILVRDVRDAIAALHSKDIEKRCAALNHAFLVLGCLQSSLDMEKGGAAARNLSRFYSYLRGRLLEAQIKGSAEILSRQIDLILQVRQTWQQVDTSPSATASKAAAPLPANVARHPYGNLAEDRASSSWSA